jgi:hypothetical protein
MRALVRAAAVVQGMIMAALGNALGGDVLGRAVATPDAEHALRPVIGVERFGAGR